MNDIPVSKIGRLTGGRLRANFNKTKITLRREETGFFFAGLGIVFSYPSAFYSAKGAGLWPGRLRGGKQAKSGGRGDVFAGKGEEKTGKDYRKKYNKLSEGNLFWKEFCIWFIINKIGASKSRSPKK